MSAGGGRRRILDAFGQALEREAHVLAWRPDLTWPQLYNLLWPRRPAHRLGERR